MPKDAEAALRPSNRLVSSVTAIHAMGHAHGDIAPKNIIVFDDGRDLELLEAVMRLLERIATETGLVEALSSGKTQTPIGVICMYSAQKARIEEAFSRRPWDARFRNMVRIDTVDSYQGKENAIVIVSLVRCNDRRDQGHVRIPNRCNVALSRAKERLFIVGARSMWGQVQKQSPMRKVLNEIEAGGEDVAVVKVGDVRS
jgi:hypothetical protein